MAAELVLIGGGRMGEALLGGLLASGEVDPSAVAVVEAAATRRQVLAAEDGLAGRHRGVAVVDRMEAAAPAPGFGAIVAVKPADVPAACAALVPADPARVLSVAAGITIAHLASWLGMEVPPHGPADPGPAVLRAMPNTPALVGAGAAGLAAAPWCGPEDVAWGERILGAVGLVVTVKEALLEAVTGLSGSGPAYAFLVAEAMTDAGVLLGLTREVAAALAGQTLLGSGRMLRESGEGAADLRAAVTSPGGTTAAGLRALEAAGVRAAIIDAVEASALRARAIGQGPA